MSEPDGDVCIAHDYSLTPVKPVFDGEPAYEDMIDGYWQKRDPHAPRMGAEAVRRKAYQAAFAGACGHTYGHNDVQIFWSPGKPQEAGNRNPWREALEAPGAGQMRHLRALMESWPFPNRIPDQSVLVSPAGSGREHVCATRAADGSYALVYLPRGGSVTIDLSKISGAGMRASWFDPRTGAYTAIGEYPIGGRRFSTRPARRRGATIGCWCWTASRCWAGKEALKTLPNHFPNRGGRSGSGRTWGLCRRRGVRDDGG